MLPFLKNKMEGSVSEPADSVTRKPDDEDGLEIDSLEVAMQELFAAKSDKERAAAFRAAFQLLEDQPYSEASNG